MPKEPKMPRKPSIPTQPNQRYGSLVAIRKLPKTPGMSYWECECDCGNNVEVAGRLLTQGRKTSCGCQPEEYCGTKYKPGDKIERLTLVSYADGKWLCRCDCGKQTTIRTVALTNGNTRSCGCLHSEISREIVKEVHELNRRLEPTIATAKIRWGNYNRVNDPYLTFDQFLELTSSNCTYCGIEPSRIWNAFAKKSNASDFSRENGDWQHNGIDRTDCKQPYILSNCCTACFTCNSAKSDQTVKEFLERVPRYKIQPFVPLIWQAKELPVGSQGLSIWLAYKSHYRDGDITPEEFYWASELPCFYCGDEKVGYINFAAHDWKSSAEAKANGTFRYNGLDRIDSARGHFKDNVVPACGRCNWAKLNLTLDEFQGWMARIQAFQAAKSISNTNLIVQAS